MKIRRPLHRLREKIRKTKRLVVWGLAIHYGMVLAILGLLVLLTLAATNGCD